MGMEVAGQRLTFPFPFVHQQPHDCGNKTINRWETSLWNLSYNLSAVNILHNLLLPSLASSPIPTESRTKVEEQPMVRELEGKFMPGDVVTKVSLESQALD